MSYVTVSETCPALYATRRSPLPATLGRRLEDRQFLTMHRAFALTGGLLTGDQAANIMRRHAEQPISSLARRIVDRTVLSIVWESQILLPAFQFDRATMSVRPAVRLVINELAAAFDDWEMALWFAEPNAWLEGTAPVDLLEKRPTSVLQAARVDRFVVTG